MPRESRLFDNQNAEEIHLINGILLFSKIHEFFQSQGVEFM